MKPIPASLAIFARTPKLSAPKTRLAAQCGAQAAGHLYKLALACAADLGRELVGRGWTVSWAVAEAGGQHDSYWKQTGLPAFSSGTGELGSRLAHTYQRLIAQGQVALMIGSDTPQLSAQQLVDAQRLARAENLAAGPAADGGFYVFAGTESIAEKCWLDVAYSQADTLQQLCAAIDRPISMLEPQADFDELDSLAAVVQAMPATLSDAQQEFCVLAQQVLASGALD